MIKLLQLNVTVYGQNCRIIYNDESHDALVVDPGGNCEQIERLLEEHKLKLINSWAFRSYRRSFSAS